MKNYKLEDLGMNSLEIFVSNDSSELGVWVKTHLKGDLHDLFITFRTPNLIVSVTSPKAEILIEDENPYLYCGEEYVKLIIADNWGKYSFSDMWITMIPNFVADLAEAIVHYLESRISDFFSDEQLLEFATNQEV